MDWILLLVWAVLLTTMIVFGRISRYHHREATYWLMHVAFVDLAMHIAEQHPEAQDAIKHLLHDLKGSSDLHQMEGQLMSTWDKIKDGGRL